MRKLLLLVLLVTTYAWGFPSSPSNGDYWQQDGARFRYSSTGKVWNKLEKVLYVSPFQYSSLQTEVGIQAALTAIGSSEEELVIDEAYTINNDITIPSNVKLRVSSSGLITITSGKILTINSNIIADRYNIFAGSVSGVRINNKDSYVYPEWFGVVADDDSYAESNRSYLTTSIRSLQIGGIVSFGNGTYYIQGINGGGTGQKFVTITNSNIILQGQKNGSSIIKIPDNYGNYDSIFYSSNVNNIVVDGITFDHNHANNLLATKAEYNAYKRATYFFYGGDNFVFKNNKIINSTSRVDVYSFDDNTHAVTNVLVENNTISNAGYTNLTDFYTVPLYDNSSIHTQGDNIKVVKNTILGHALGVVDSPGSVNAIELHGSNILADGNIIKNYGTGIVDTGVSTSSIDKGHIVSNNIINTHTFGIIPYSVNTYGGTAGIKEFTYNNNTIMLDYENSGYTSIKTFAGIWLATSSNIPVNNILIQNNSINFLSSDPSYAYLVDDNVSGIGFSCVTLNTLYVSNVKIKNNVLSNIPLTGIKINNCDIDKFEVSDNSFVNTAYNTNVIYADKYRSILYIASNGASNISVSNNTIADNNATALLKYIVYTDGTDLNASAYYSIVNNKYEITGSTASLINVIGATVTANKFIPYIYENNPLFLDVTTYAKKGSRIYNQSNTTTYYTLADGTTFNQEFYGTAAPIAVVPYIVGDKVINTVPSAGGYEGWVNVGAGSPGTWKGYGAIAP